MVMQAACEVCRSSADSVRNKPAIGQAMIVPNAFIQPVRSLNFKQHLAPHKCKMTQVSLVDSVRLSALLQDALSWNDTVTSLLVSARNGSILAHAFRNTTPSIKAMRTRSTTMTAAYSVASEDVLVFEAQNSRALTVIAPIADHIVLAVTGSEPLGPDPYEQHVHDDTRPNKTSNISDLRNGESDEDEDEEDDASREQVRSDLEQVNQELAKVLREELSGLKWPDDI